ncbi:MAG: DUF2157 domain-containing protein [Treponema sp.]|nr:DUF2157 domain-containing protein [Treponema sp.]
MNPYHVDWLLKELSTLEKEKVITSAASGKIRNYYEIKLKEQREENQRMLEEMRKKRKNIPVSMVLSIIAALLVTGGIISIIAYNWTSISRLAKTAAAFVIMFTTPAVYAFMKFKLKKEISVRINEVMSILWSILFGAGISFISQIYRLPSNPALFFLVWAVSTILILYCTESYFAFGFSVLLTVIYCMVGQFVMRTDAVFAYLLIAAVVPYALSKKGLKYVSVAETVFLLGFVLEKSVPGLWILCYVSLFVLMFNFGIEKDEKVFKFAGGTGCIVLLSLLSCDYFWKNIGFSFYRTTEGFNAGVSVCDYIITILLVISGCFVSVKSIVTKFKAKNGLSDTLIIQTASVLFLLLTYTWFACCSVNPQMSVFTKDLFFVFAVLISYFFMTRSKNKLFYLSLFAVLLSGLYANMNYALPFAIVFVFLTYINLVKNKAFAGLKVSQTVYDNLFMIFPVLSLFTHSLNGFEVINRNYTGYCLNAAALVTAIIMCGLELVPLMKETYKQDKGRFISLVEFTVINAASLFLITWKSINMEFSFIAYPGFKTVALIEKYFILASAVYYFAMKLFKKREMICAVIIAFAMITFSLNSFDILIASTAFCGLYLWFTEREKGLLKNAAIVTSKIFTILFSLIAVFFCKEFNWNLSYLKEIDFTPALFLFTALAFFEFVPLVKLLIEKKKFDYTFTAMSFLFLLLLICPDTDSGEYLFKEILSYAFLTVIVLYSVLGMFKSYRNNSLSKFNLYIVLMSFVILIKFFLVSDGLIETGVMFICFGIAIFVMNQIFLNRQKQAPELKNADAELKGGKTDEA